MIDVSDIDQAELLAALYNAIDISSRVGLPSFPEPMTVADARRIIAERTRDGVCRFDYLNGRPLKIELGPQMNGLLYDRDNGARAFRRVVDKLRGKSSIVEHDTRFYIFQDDELRPSKDYREAVRIPLRVYERFDLHTKSQVRRERRRMARAGVHGRRVWRKNTRRISRIDAEWSLTPIREQKDETYTARRIGFGTEVQDRHKPREIWPKLTRQAFVYVRQGEEIPERVKAELTEQLQRELMSVAQQMYEKINGEA
jgi:hypothetical protein